MLIVYISPKHERIRKFFGRQNIFLRKSCYRSRIIFRKINSSNSTKLYFTTKYKSFRKYFQDFLTLGWKLLKFHSIFQAIFQPPPEPPLIMTIIHHMFLQSFFNKKTLIRNLYPSQKKLLEK